MHRNTHISLFNHLLHSNEKKSIIIYTCTVSFFHLLPRATIIIHVNWCIQKRFSFVASYCWLPLLAAAIVGVILFFFSLLRAYLYILIRILLIE